MRNASARRQGCCIKRLARACHARGNRSVVFQRGASASVHTCTCINVHVHLHKSKCKLVHKNMHICINKHMYEQACDQKRRNAHVYVYKPAHTCMYKFTHIPVSTNRRSPTFACSRMHTQMYTCKRQQTRAKVQRKLNMQNA